MANKRTPEPASKISSPAELQTNARRTGTRARQSAPTPRWGVAPVLTETPPVAKLEPSAAEEKKRQLHPSVAPESLLTPYASLTPRERPEALEQTQQSPQNSGARPSHLAPASLGRKVRQTNTTCLIHGLARSPDGTCMLCVKELAILGGARRGKWLLAIMFIALAMALAITLSL